MAAELNNADSGRRELFKAYLGGRAAVWAILLGSSAAFLVGAWQREVLIMTAGPAAVVLAVAGLAFAVADRTAAERFYSNFAVSLGLVHVGRQELLTLTPLLGAGDRRWCEHWMQGVLPGDPALAGGLGHFVFENVQQRRDSDGDRTSEVVDRRRLTLSVVELEPSMALFKGVFLRPRRGIFETRADWMRKSTARKIEMESSAFTRRYELRLADDQDENLARQLLSPSLVSWLAAHPLSPGFELKAGTLAIFLERSIEDAGNLTFFLDATRRVAGRVLREVEEARAGSAA